MSSVKLDSTTTSYEELEENYHDFIAPTFKVKIDNHDAFKLGIAIESVSVANSTSDEADMAEFTIVNAYNLVKRNFKWTDSLLTIGNSIEVSMGYRDKVTPLFSGYITHIEFNFSQSDSPTITVRAMDIIFFMMRQKKSQIWSNVSIKNLVMEIGRSCGATDFEFSDDPDLDVVLQEISNNKYSNHEFLNKIAEELDHHLFAVGKILYFIKITEDRTPVTELEWGKQLQSFRVEHDISDQVTKVVVNGNIKNSHVVVKKESGTISKVGSNSQTGADLMKKIGSFIEEIHETVEDENEAKQLADSRLQQRSMNLVQASGSCIGLPEIRSGRYIKIGGLSKKLNSLYYISSSTHTIDGSGYQTTFNLKGNAV